MDRLSWSPQAPGLLLALVVGAWLLGLGLAGAVAELARGRTAAPRGARCAWCAERLATWEREHLGRRCFECAAHGWPGRLLRALAWRADRARFAALGALVRLRRKGRAC